ncbi:putative calcium transporting P-type ATPase [Tothia fuscella]|uniref:Calcium-transporting ATPase n=1 Tax=Tothia fuscella TaxID=1048955 RepID=A0A9P4NJW7_9PEZI|nr:putative calcium transporting P-type ATPase [Tothia fuscella]
MVEKNSAPPLRRPRAPTITVDTSAVSEQHDPELSSPTTALSGNPNSLAVPAARSRGDSVDSTSTATTSSHTYVDAASPSIHQASSAPSFTSMAAEEDPLSPDPGQLDSFKVDNNPFAFSPGQLSKLINPKSFAAFMALGGLAGLEKGLRTNIHSGLSVDENNLSGQVSFEEAKAVAGAQKISPTKDDKPDLSRAETEHTLSGAAKTNWTDRKRVYGDNRLPGKKAKSLLELAWIALQDKVLILLSIAAVISLALGLYTTFGTKHKEGEGAKVDWVEGVAIIVAITIVVMVGAVNDWQKERQFVKLNKKKEDRYVKVVRDGKTMKASVYDVFVGDIMILEQGDVLPVDGIFISGHNVTCDESSATGESDLLKKTPAEEAFQTIRAGKETKKLDPFILSGAKVSEGVGTFLVTAVGVNSSYGKTMMALREDNDITPLQYKLNILAGYIAKLGSAAGLLLFVVVFIEWAAKLPKNKGNPQQKAQEFLQILIIAITIIVVAVPEGLPLAVTLALAFATKRMTKDNNLVRHLQSCETMGNATVICSDKTGTLTQNVMTVVSGTLGPGTLRFGDKEQPSSTPATAAPTTADSPTSQETAVSRNSSVSSHEPTVKISMSDLSNALHPDLRELLRQSIAINTTAFEGEENGKAAFIGSKTETALLDWAQQRLGMDKLSVERANYPLEQLFPFDSSRKGMGAVVKLGENRYRMFFKGAPEILLVHCTTIIDNPAEKLAHIPLEESHKKELKHIISSYAQRSLRTIGFAYRDFDTWPPPRGLGSKQTDTPNDADFADVFRQLNWLGVVGIQDPVRDGVAAAVKDCQRASVRVKMVTGDNVETATAIAKECGILTEGGLVMEGPDFRRLPPGVMEAKVMDLCVLARSSPEDKKILVKCLKGLNQVVAVTGDGTNDAPALKAADVGFSMGITGTEVAKEASDIILMDDNFSSIVKALAWGRTINDAVKKFLQFQITVNITAVVLTFVTAVVNKPVLNAVQLLWVNLIMDTFAALALATDPPTGSLLDRKPEPKNSALINFTMWKMIIGQSIFQLVVTFVLVFAGPGFLGYPDRVQSTLVFNVFVWMQIFNAINSRRIDNTFNVLEGFHKNYLFMMIMLIMIGGQTLIVFVGGAAFVVTKLNGVQWGISVIIGLLSLPMGALIRCIPDSLVRKIWEAIVPEVLRRKRPTNINAPGNDYDINKALLDIKDDLAFLKRIRGGRINSLKQTIKHPKGILQQRSRSGSRLSNSPMHSALGMPGLLAGSIVGISSPVDRPTTQRENSGGLAAPRTSDGRPSREEV